MKKRGLIIFVVALFVLLILIAVSGPILIALGVEVFCISNEGGRPRLVRCGGDTALP